MNPYTLSDIWKQQQIYNRKVMELQHKTSSEWFINYLLGVTSQLSELLKESHWRDSSITSVAEFGPNTAEELADITKYLLSLWQILGYSEEDMLSSVYQKGTMLEQLMYQETRPKLIDRNILILDLDGVVANFREGFMAWLSGTTWKDTLTLDNRDIGLHLDINNGWNYHNYHQAKIQFEQCGGYGLLPPIERIKKCVNALHRVGWYVIVYTARPYTVYKRIWGDTWRWLQEHEIEVDELHFGFDSRVIAASYLAEDNHVISIEDDPTLIKRYVGCNIPVLLCPQPYNQNIFLNSNYLRLIQDEHEHWDISNTVHNTIATGAFDA